MQFPQVSGRASGSRKSSWEMLCTLVWATDGPAESAALDDEGAAGLDRADQSLGFQGGDRATDGAPAHAVLGLKLRLRREHVVVLAASDGRAQDRRQLLVKRRRVALVNSHGSEARRRAACPVTALQAVRSACLIRIIRIGGPAACCQHADRAWAPTCKEVRTLTESFTITACAYCQRTGQQMEPCCDRPEHAQRLVCADIRGCLGVILGILHEQEEREQAWLAGATPDKSASTATLAVPQSEFGGMHPELRARITAASAVAADFTQETNAYLAAAVHEAFLPDFIGWAWRLHSELRSLLGQLREERS